MLVQEGGDGIESVDMEAQHQGGEGPESVDMETQEHPDQIMEQQAGGPEPDTAVSKVS